MKIVLMSIALVLVMGACASKQGFDQKSYDRQNNAAEKSQNSL